MIICGDALTELRKLPSESVHCCITSPPYWGLRDYGISDQLGLEKTPEDYVAKLVEIFHEVKRVLRSDGVMFLNLGDSYTSSGRSDRKESPGVGAKQEMVAPGRTLKWQAGGGHNFSWSIPSFGINLKPKDLVGIPWRMAFALQTDGWWLRSDIVWAKPNPMPESVRDRPTRSHEYIFLLTKSAKYFFDQEAVRELANYDGRKDTYMKGSQKYSRPAVPGQAAHTFASRGHERWPGKLEDGSPGRNIRSVWTMATKPFKEAHFSTFPPELPERCIKAGTSEKGVCPKCGAPWVRVVEKIHSTRTFPDNGKGIDERKADGTNLRAGEIEVVTLGWWPSCKCNAGNPIPAVVLDPFFGAGTVGVVAKQLGRNFIGIEINPEYCKMAERRLAQTNYQPKFDFKVEEKETSGV